MARVSIVVPTHNRASLLTRAVESAFRSSTDVEVIVVDDASTDDTPEVCRELGAIRYLRLDRNLGPAGARNAGILQSSSEFVAFLDDDDIRLPGSLDIQVRILESELAAAFVYGQVLIGDDQYCQPTGEIVPQGCPKGDVFWELLTRNFVPSSSVVVRKRIFEHVGLFDAKFSNAEDWDMWIRIAEHYQVAAAEEPVAVYRSFSRSSGQLSSNSVTMFNTASRVQARGLNLPRSKTAPLGKRRQARKNFLNWAADVLISDAALALSEGAKREACKRFFTALRLNPVHAIRPYALRHLAGTALRHKVSPEINQSYMRPEIIEKTER